MGAAGMSWKKKSEIRAREAMNREAKRRDMKQKAVRMRSLGFTISQIANQLGVSEGTVHGFLSVNGGF